MESIQFSRWPTLTVGHNAEGVQVYIFDSENIPERLAGLAESLGVDIKKVPDKYEIKSVHDTHLHLFCQMNPKLQSKPSTQRGLMNSLQSRLSSRDTNGDNSCTIHVLNPHLEMRVIDSFVRLLYEFSVFKAEKCHIKDIYITGDLTSAQIQELQEIRTMLPWICFAKDLVNYPPNKKSTTQLRKAISDQLAASSHTEITVWEGDSLKERFEPIHAVNQGAIEPAVLMRIEYKPPFPKNTKPIVLVGKGIVFDNGGVNIKLTGTILLQMKNDMAGAATVASICGICAAFEYPIHIIAYLPIADNAIGPNALKPGSVISLPKVKEPKEKEDYTTIEVSDTDAEGRLILCSAINHAAIFDNPELIITVATLCGSTESMLGSLMAAAVSRTDELLKDIKAAGRATDEPYAQVQPPPDVIDECLSDYEGDIAELQNCNWHVVDGDTLQAFSMLQYFAPGLAFLHLDICGTAFYMFKTTYRSKRRREPGATGWGVRSVTEFLRKRFLK